MAYPESVKLRAFQMYVLHGKNAEEIARTLQSEFPQISANTIREWIRTEKDPYTGSDWDTSRETVQSRSRELVMADATKQKVRIQEDVKALREKLYKTIMGDGAPAPKTYEGMIYALKTLMAFEIELEKQNENPQADPMTALHIVLEVLSEDDEVAPVIKRRWPRINAEVLKRMNTLMEAKDITPVARRKG
jgi:transposase-like protein